MRKYGDWVWEMAVPNGWYLVYATVGDPNWITGTYGLDVEGTLTVVGDPLYSHHWFDDYAVVEVADGRLTLSPALDRAKISFIDVIALPEGAGGFSVNVNFQTAGFSTPAGHLPDIGALFGDRGNGFSYGWDMDATGGARYRTYPVAVDGRYATLNHMQRRGDEYAWAMDVPDGIYAVYIVAGDPAYFSDGRMYGYDVEGVEVANGTGETTPRFRSPGMLVIVAVNDGRLNISNATFANRNKIQIIEIVRLDG